MRKIDLHVHTSMSDGSETPENTVRHAFERNLAAIAITDHDGVGGIERAQAAGKEYGIEVVPGIELGCGWYGREVHMLGYFIDRGNKPLQDTLKWVVEDKFERNRKMAENMAADGIVIDIDELIRRYPGSVIGRPHFALALIENGLADSVLDAFRRYLDPGQKYYIRRNFLSVEEAASLIRGAGGKPVIAHPRQYRMSPERYEELLQRASAAGVAGIECYYSGYTAEQSEELRASAEAHGFCVTAGSDWHGSHKPLIEMGYGMHGELSADYSILENLKNY